MAADDLVTPGARPSTAKVLIIFSQNIPVSSLKGLKTVCVDRLTMKGLQMMHLLLLFFNWYVYLLWIYCYEDFVFLKLHCTLNSDDIMLIVIC